MSLYSELKRRNVFRVAIAYLASAWLLTEIAGTLFPIFGYGDAPARIVVVLLAIGFPLFLIFSWVFEITPEGLKLEREVRREESIAPATGKKLDRTIIVLLALALGYFAVDKFLIEPARDAALVEQTAAQARAETLVESYGDKSIAVLPFVNLSADPEQDYFSDGISEELLNMLAQIPDLRVVSRSSSFSFRGEDIPIPKVAERLNVTNVLEGSVRKAGDRIRITAQLIDARSDTHLWSQTYDHHLSTRNLLAIQAEIAQQISDELDTVLTEGDRERMSRLPTENLDAYYSYHLGKQHMINRTVDSLKKAASMFRQAIELDPDYALAYVGLADTYMLLGDYGDLSLDTVIANAEPALDRALELDPKLAPAYASLGAIRTKQYDFEAAEAAHQHAIDLDSNYATTYHWYGDLLVNYVRQPGRALPLLQRALTLDPLSPSVAVTLGQAFEGVGEFEQALSFYNRAIEIEPDYPGSYMLVGRIYHLAFSRLDEAYQWRTEGLLRNPTQVNALANMGLMLLDLGDVELAERWIEKARTLGPKHFSANEAQCFLYRYRGQNQEALETARKLFEILPGNNATVATLVAFGRYDEALQLYAESNPELTCTGPIRVTPVTTLQALNLSLAFERKSNQECADQLLESVLEQIQNMPRLGSFGYGIADVEVYARQGKIEQALETLRSAIDLRWRPAWWRWDHGETSPHLESLREHPDFMAMMAEVEADMTSQLDRIRSLENKHGGKTL